MHTEIIRKYFPDITSAQEEQFDQLPELYALWNSRINVISRKDIENLMKRHILHSLAIAKYILFTKNTRILDVGTGGGFPGIPLAIFFPDCHFHLVDGIAKKILVVKEVSTALKLTNVLAEQKRAEEIPLRYDFIVSRAVSGLQEFYNLTHKKLSTKWTNSKPNGILYLKGGEIEKELDFPHSKHHIYPLSKWYEEAFFETKQLVHLY